MLFGNSAVMCLCRSGAGIMVQGEWLIVHGYDRRNINR